MGYTYRQHLELYLREDSTNTCSVNLVNKTQPYIYGFTSLHVCMYVCMFNLIYIHLPLENPYIYGFTSLACEQKNHFKETMEGYIRSEL